MSTISNANARATKATGARAKKEFDETFTSSDGVVRVPSEETLAAIADVEAGNVKSFDSIEELKADLLGKAKS